MFRILASLFKNCTLSNHTISELIVSILRSTYLILELRHYSQGFFVGILSLIRIGEHSGRKHKLPVDSQNWNSVTSSFLLRKLVACVLFISFSKYLLKCTISPALVLEKPEMCRVVCIMSFSLLLMKQ